jgi:uncharacterized protein (DUF302 family)
MLAVKSNLSFEECERRIKERIKTLGLKIFCEVDHSKNAKEVGLWLNNTKLILFGNPKVGTLLMQDDQKLGYELPLRVAIWENDEGVFVGGKLVSEIVKEYDIRKAEIVKKMDEVINTVVNSCS